MRDLENYSNKICFPTFFIFLFKMDNKLKQTNIFLFKMKTNEHKTNCKVVMVTVLKRVKIVIFSQDIENSL